MIRSEMNVIKSYRRNGSCNHNEDRSCLDNDLTREIAFEKIYRENLIDSAIEELYRSDMNSNENSKLQRHSL